MDQPTRRVALLAASSAAAAAALGRTAAEEPARPGLTVRQSEPRNLESPFAEFDTFLTPADQFFVRSHFAAPTVVPTTYRLKVEGAVENPLDLSLADLEALPVETLPLTLECAGNGRVFLVPPARGLQWQFGAVGTAEWTGTRLSSILDKAKAKSSAVEVILVGADTGAIAADPATPGVIHFDRSLPIAKAKKPEVLIAHGMNREPLPPAHGGPVRAVVGGWYGMASVKWLSRIVVSEIPHAGYWQTFDYSYFERRSGGLPSMKAVTAIQPKAQIARPQVGEVVPAGKPYKIRGFAWAGEADVGKVEVSSDGGQSWQRAKLTGEEKPFCWRSWEFPWEAPSAPGTVKLLARCTDASGRGQPEKRDPDRRSYLINHLVPVEVTIR
jgi:DMSO/TMAO reductase YedYZ molybdopterin-dependent catalytic subunit